jgi:hypothetical protein
VNTNDRKTYLTQAEITVALCQTAIFLLAAVLEYRGYIPRIPTIWWMFFGYIFSAVTFGAAYLSP